MAKINPKHKKRKKNLYQKIYTKPLPTTQEINVPRCGLCGKTTNLTKTECCNQWICNDEEQYVMFSYAQNSCYRNHSRYTLCGSHYTEEHAGDWKDCEECRNGFETEMYVWYGTNEYNFEKLPNPPKYDPTKCAKCGKTINLGKDGYTMKSKKYYCMNCMNIY